MTQIVLVHGIANKMKGPHTLLADLYPALADGLALAGSETGLVSSLAGLAGAVAELREAQQHAAQAAAARAGAEHLHNVLPVARAVAGLRQQHAHLPPVPGRHESEFPARPAASPRASRADNHPASHTSTRRPAGPGRRAGPAP